MNTSTVVSTSNNNELISTDEYFLSNQIFEEEVEKESIECDREWETLPYFLSSNGIVLVNYKDFDDPCKKLNVNQERYLYQMYQELDLAVVNDEAFLIEENAELPNDDVISSVKNTLSELAFINIFPERITTSIEGGLCLIFHNNDNKLYLELYILIRK